MLERFPRARRRVRVSSRLNAGRSAARRIAGYAAVLLSGASLVALLLGDATAQNHRAGAAPLPAAPPASPARQIAELPVQVAQQTFPGPAGTRFSSQSAADLANRANDAVLRCDRAAARQTLTNMANTRRIMLQSYNRGVLPTGLDDAIAMRAAEDAVRLALSKDCPPNLIRVRGIDPGTDYGFDSGAAAADTRKRVEAAAAAAKRCDRDAYFEAVSELRAVAEGVEAAARSAGMEPEQAARLRADAARIRALVAYLVRTAEERFKNCPPGGRRAADAPPPPRVDPATPPRTDPTPPGGPQRPVGLPQAPLFIFEPWFAVSIRNNDAAGAYTNDAGFPPGSGTGDKQQSNVCGGADVMVPISLLADALRRGQERGDVGPIAFGSTDFGLRFGICELGSGEKVVFSEVRHGADGAVTLSERERTEIQLLFLVQQNFFFDFGSLFGPTRAWRGEQYASLDLAQAPGMRARNWWPFAVYFGVGPSFVRTEITMTSNQAPGGGVLQSASEKRWDTGLSFVFGGKTAICRNCVFGNPVMFGIEGQWTTLPARNIGITSSTFGFVEQGRVSSRSASKVTFRLTVPFGIGR